MYTINDDLSIYVTRGDIVSFSVEAEDAGENYVFQPGDVVRIKVYGKKDAETVYLVKDFPVLTASQSVDIYLTEQDTKFGDVISKPTDFWYEVELNPDTDPQTIIGYDEDGAKVFKLFPEGDDVEDSESEITPEDIPLIDDELDLTSQRPVQNQAIARAVVNLKDGFERVSAAVAEKFVTPQMFGAIGDGEADDTKAFLAAIASGSPVRVPAGEYLVDALSVDTNSTIYGDPKNKPTIKCAGIILNAEVLLSGLKFLPAGSYAGTGVLVNKSGCEVSDCIIYDFYNGLELSEKNHIVGGVFKNLTIGYCSMAGVMCIASGNAQKNQIVFDHLYIVNNGYGYEDDTAEATTLESGFGMYINGGYAIEVRNCVFEYNTGVGLYLAQTYPLYGCNVTSPYFEHNKYAQLYVANVGGTYMKNVHISGEFYTDAGRSLPANALPNRGLYIENNGNLKCSDADQGNYFSRVSAIALGYANRYCPNNAFPYDVIGELQNPYLTLGEYGGEKVWAINNGAATVYSCPIPVEKGNYTVEIDIAHSGEAEASFVFALTGHGDGTKSWTISATAEWATISRDVSFTDYGVCNLYVSNNTGNTIYIKNIRIVKA